MLPVFVFPVNKDYQRTKCRLIKAKSKAKEVLDESAGRSLYALRLK